MPLKSLQLRKVADRSGPAPKEGEPWPLKHVVLMAPPPRRHEFADDFVMRAANEGWLTLAKGNIVIHLKDQDLTYKIMRLPGRYKDGKPTELINDSTVEVFHSYDAKLVDA